MTPSTEDLWFVPLGGCGEIGMNLNLFGHDGRWLMVDCGVTFEETLQGNEVQMPDPHFISERTKSLVGIVATHAHMDHIGALPTLQISSAARFIRHRSPQRCWPPSCGKLEARRS